MPAPKTTKSATTAKKAPVKKSSTSLPAPKPKPKPKPKPLPFEIWRCKVDWVKFHGKIYYKGDTLNVFPATLEDESEMRVIKRYFVPTKTESIEVISEPVEILKGD